MKNYTIEKKSGPTLEWIVLAETSSNNYIDQTEAMSGLNSHEVWYMVRANDVNGKSSNYSGSIEVNVAGVGLDKKGAYSMDYDLYQNYPNPFNPSTNINFTLPNSEFVTLKIYDILGKEVTTLINEEMNAGSHTKIWDASNLSSGVYFYKLQAGNFTETKKMILIR